MNEPNIQAGDRARKIGGSYQADGTIVSVFKTKAGKWRVVFEFNEPAGMLHIFNTDQVVALPEETK
jgi:hypothetical protein